MKTLKFPFFLFFVTILAFNACSNVSKSGEVGDQFYAYLQQKDYDAIIQLLDNKALEKYSAAEWKDLFSARNSYFGTIKSYKPVGFHTETIKDHKIIKLDYQVDNDNGLVYEEIKLINQDDQLKILSYSFSPDIAMNEK